LEIKDIIIKSELNSIKYKWKDRITLSPQSHLRMHLKKAEKLTHPSSGLMKILRMNYSSAPLLMRSTIWNLAKLLKLVFQKIFSWLKMEQLTLVSSLGENTPCNSIDLFLV